jgi:hypothetical protein
VHVLGGHMHPSASRMRPTVCRMRPTIYRMRPLRRRMRPLASRMRPQQPPTIQRGSNVAAIVDKVSPDLPYPRSTRH